MAEPINPSCSECHAYYPSCESGLCSYCDYKRSHGDAYFDKRDPDYMRRLVSEFHTYADANGFFPHCHNGIILSPAMFAGMMKVNTLSPSQLFKRLYKEYDTPILLTPVQSDLLRTIFMDKPDNWKYMHVIGKFSIATWMQRKGGVFDCYYIPEDDYGITGPYFPRELHKNWTRQAFSRIVSGFPEDIVLFKCQCGARCTSLNTGCVNNQFIHRGCPLEGRE